MTRTGRSGRIGAGLGAIVARAATQRLERPTASVGATA